MTGLPLHLTSAAPRTGLTHRPGRPLLTVGSGRWGVEFPPDPAERSPDASSCPRIQPGPGCSSPLGVLLLSQLPLSPPAMCSPQEPSLGADTGLQGAGWWLIWHQLGLLGRVTGGKTVGQPHRWDSHTEQAPVFWRLPHDTLAQEPLGSQASLF